MTLWSPARPVARSHLPGPTRFGTHSWMNELWTQISKAAAGIAFGASLVILAIQLPGGVAQAIGLGDALSAALSVSMAAVAVWVVCQLVRPRH